MCPNRLLARIDEDECSLHGVILAASLIALSRTVKASCERKGEALPSSSQEGGMSFNVSNSFNLRNCFKTYVPKHGALTGHFEQSFTVPPDIDDVSEFWKIAHDLNLKLQVMCVSSQTLHLVWSLSPDS